MISKALYEFLIIMEASNKYEEKTHIQIADERIKLFDKRNESYLLATRLKEVIDPYSNIDISLGDAYTYAKVWINNGYFPKEKFKDFIDGAESLSNGTAEKDLKMSYSKIRQEPLFVEIMGENAKDQIPQLEKLLNEPINIGKITKIPEVYERLEELDEKLEAKVEKGIIKNDQYEYWTMQLDYLGVYYNNILKDKQKQMSSLSPSKLGPNNNEYYEPMEENSPFIGEGSRHKKKMERQQEFESDPLEDMLNEYKEKYSWSEMSEEEQIRFADAFEEKLKNQESQLEPVEKVEPIEGRRRL